MSQQPKINAATRAVREALSRAKGHAGTAAIAAMLAPLAMTPAAAAPYTSITASTTDWKRIFTYTYEVSNASNSPAYLYEFELPEIHAGDFDLSTFDGPDGWSVNESATPNFATTGFKTTGATPGAYVLFYTSYAALGEGMTGDFSLSTKVTGSTNVNFTTAIGLGTFDVGYRNDGTETIDPIIPGTLATAAVVPEPPITALMFGGLAAALAFARRRKA